MSESPPLPARVRDRAGLDALLASATNYEEKLPRDPLRRALDLGRMRALLAFLEHPQVGPRTVHVAGSKGKGTVARMVAAGLRAAGRGPVGLYTSPHLEDLSERVEVDGRAASGRALARAADALLPHVRATRAGPDAPTFFELFTAIAWHVFRASGCREVVLETGLGGRLDATTVCVPAVTVITSIELEHVRLLGDTLEAIAAEKAGILKPDVPAVAVDLDPRAREVVARRARELGAPLLDGADVRVPAHVELPAEHLRANARAAFLALRTLDVPADTAWAGIARARLPGILETVAQRPRVVVDGAHTPRSAEATRAAVAARWPDSAPVLLLALLEEKDVAGVAGPLARGATRVVVTQVDSPRCRPAAALAAEVAARVAAPVEARPDLREALATARAAAGPDGLVLASGSVYLAGAVRALARDA